MVKRVSEFKLSLTIINYHAPFDQGFILIKSTDDDDDDDTLSQQILFWFKKNEMKMKE